MRRGDLRMAKEMEIDHEFSFLWRPEEGQTLGDGVGCKPINMSIGNKDEEQFILVTTKSSLHHNLIITGEFYISFLDQNQWINLNTLLFFSEKKLLLTFSPKWNFRKKINMCHVAKEKTWKILVKYIFVG